MLSSASSHARSIDALSLTLLIVSSVLVVAVWVLIIFLCLKYRVGRRVDRTHPPLRPRRMEIGLSALIFVMGLAIFIWSAKLYYDIYLGEAHAHVINVIAKQWMWTIHDPTFGDDINRLVVPVDQPIRLIMTSEDVIHSFYIPALRIKQDVLPGQYTSLSLTASELGKFDILCTQYCGLDHSEMRGVLEVVTRDQYLNGQHPAAPSGFKIYQRLGCANCHDNPAIAPPLTHIFGTTVRLQNGTTKVVDDSYLRQSIFDPGRDVVRGYPDVMPNYRGRISETEMVSLIEFLKENQQ